MNGKKHQKHLQTRTETQERQARLVASTPADGCYPQIALDGTRQTSVSTEDCTFCRRVLRLFLGAGIPLNLLNTVLLAMEDMSKKLLESRTMLVAKHITPMLDAEIELQTEELKGKRESLCFDGTQPRLGVVFAMIAHCVEADDGKASSCQ